MVPIIDWTHDLMLQLCPKRGDTIRPLAKICNAKQILKEIENQQEWKNKIDLGINTKQEKARPRNQHQAMREDQQ